jgi:hypothetical protein
LGKQAKLDRIMHSDTWWKKTSLDQWVLHIIVDEEQKMHTLKGLKHKPKESFLIEIYEVVYKPFEVCQRICNHIWNKIATQA